jgi:hypothetical protein
MAKQRHVIRSMLAETRIDDDRPSVAWLIFHPDSANEIHIELRRSTFQKLRDAMTAELRRGLTRRRRPSSTLAKSTLTKSRTDNSGTSSALV